MAAWLAPAAVAGASVVGGLLANKSSKDATKDAAKQAEKSLEFQKYMYELSRQDFAPYQNVGQSSLYEMAGYSPTTAPGTAPTMGREAMWNEVPTYSGTGRDRVQTGTKRVFGGYRDVTLPGTKDVTTWSKTGEGVDPTGGAKEYFRKLQDFSTNFEFNPDDISYKFKQGESEKGINKYLASRGLYNSRAGLNLLDESNRAITADETQRQYSRGYGSIMDQYNMSMNMGAVDYNKLLGMAQMGQGAAGTMGNVGMATGQGVASSYGDLGGLELLKGASDRDFYSGLGATPLNYMMLQQMFGNSGSSGTSGFTPMSIV